MADSLIKVTSQVKPNFRFLYDLNSSIEDKILKIATEMYGAGSVELEEPVKKKLKLYYECVSWNKARSELGNLRAIFICRDTTNSRFAWARHPIR